MKAYLITMLVIDEESLGEQHTKELLEFNRFINPLVIDCLQADIGSWTDEHLLNQTTDKDVIKQSYQWLPIS